VQQHAITQTDQFNKMTWRNKARLNVCIAKDLAENYIETYLKKVQPWANPPEADPKLPKCLLPRQKFNVDNKACFRYLDSYWFGLIDASIYCAALSRRSS